MTNLVRDVYFSTFKHQLLELPSRVLLLKLKAKSEEKEPQKLFNLTQMRKKSDKILL